MTSRSNRRRGHRDTGGTRGSIARGVSNAYRYAPLIAVVVVWFTITDKWGTGPLGGLVLTLAGFAALLFASWRRRLAYMQRTDPGFYLGFWTHMVHLVRVWRLFCLWSRAIAGLTLTNRGVAVLPPPRPIRGRDGVWFYVDGAGTFQGRVRHGAYAVTSDTLRKNAPALAEYLGAYEVAFKHIRRGEDPANTIIGQLATAVGAASGVSEIRVFYVDSMGRLMRLRELPVAPKGKIAFGRHADGSPAYVDAGLSTFIAGMTGSGKSNVLWTMLASYRRAGIPVRLYVSDPKGGMELRRLGRQLGKGTPMFSVHQYAKTPAATAAMIKSMHGGMVKRQEVYGDNDLRSHVPTVEDPLCILICDEFLTLTKEVKADSDTDFGRLLFQGRSVGYITIALAQDPTKQTAGDLRDMFPQRIALKLPGPHAAVPALGVAAPCHLLEGPGLGYMIRDGDMEASKFRVPLVMEPEVGKIALGELLDMPGDEVGGEPTTLYRLYGTLPVEEYPEFEGAPTLLYVGITKGETPEDFARRESQHDAEKAFMDYVNDDLTRLQVWPSRPKALEMEQLAIETERPVFNTQHNTGNPWRRAVKRRPWNHPLRRAQAEQWAGKGRTSTRPKVTAS